VPAGAAAPGTIAGAAGAAEVVETAQDVTPFWQRMPRLFLFPLQRPPLLRNLGATVLFAIVVWMGLPQLPTAPFRWGLLIFLAWVGTALFVARFGFLVIERSAAGYLDTRGYPEQESQVDWWRPIKMFLVLVFVPVAIALLGALLLPKGLVVIALLAFALLLPASVMVLTMTDSFVDAVNPSQCLRTATRIGPPYLLLCLFLFMLSISSRQAVSFLLGGHSAGGAPAAAAAQGAEAGLLAKRGYFSASVFVFTLVGNYFLVLTCALIGYTMYQYSGVLGIAVVGPGEVRRAGPISAAAHERRVREAMIGKLIAAGELKEAMELLSDEMRIRPADLSLHVRMHTLLIHEGSRPRIEAHSERYLELLLASSNFKAALALYEETQAMIPGFTPHDPARLPQLAGAAIDALKPDLAAQLIRGFDRKYPGHPKIPDVYVVGARIMLQSEHAKEARRLLEYVTATYADSPAAIEARRYLVRFAPKIAAAAPPV
jgi:tetratricopeptide (TPR) repeat protein